MSHRRFLRVLASLAVALLLAGLPLGATADAQPATCTTAGSVSVAPSVYLTGTECDGLAALYTSTAGADWHFNGQWMVPDSDPCSWYGVGCGSWGVVQLNLDGNNLTGALPPEIGGMTYLRQAFLDSNNLSGPIPAQIGNANQLFELRLQDNDMTSLPGEIGDMQSLAMLNISSNQLAALPPEIEDFRSINVIDLSDNVMTGSIPTGIGDLDELEELILTGNQLTGSIPASLGDVTTLTRISIGDNKLDGSLPVELGQLSALRILEVHENQLVGSLPAAIPEISTLTQLYANDNFLSGTIPSSLGDSNVQFLRLGHNDFSGTLPSTFASTDLVSFGLGGNRCLIADAATTTHLGGLPDPDAAASGSSGATTADALNTGCTAEADSVAVDAGSSVLVDVLANDGLATGTLTVTAQGAKGTAAIESGKIRYASSGSADASDTFTYQACIAATCDTATVTVTINATDPCPGCTAENDTATVDDNTSTLIDALDNDTLKPPDTLTIAAQGAKGTAAIESGKIRYTPAVTGPATDTFTYKACIADKCDTANVTVTINATDPCPGCTAENDTATVDDNTSTLIDALDNDTLKPPDTLTIAAQGAKGTAAIESGKIRYTPAVTGPATDTFTYKACIADKCDTANVTVTINATDPCPGCTAENDTATVDDNTSILIDVLDNDTLKPPDTLTIAAQGAKGTAAIEGSKIRYTPAVTGPATDTFTYKTCIAAKCDTANVTVTINATDPCPGCTAENDTATVESGSTVLINVGDNDSFPSDNLKVTGQASLGTATVEGDMIRYTPSTTTATTDLFTYRACVSGKCDTATVKITITTSPCVECVAQEDDATVTIDSSKKIDVLANDGADATTPEVIDQASVGTAAVEGSKIRYTPHTTVIGTDEFTYKTCVDGTCDIATVAVTITGTGVLCAGLTPTHYVIEGVPFVGTSGDDIILGSSGADVIDGRGGSDRICGEAGEDTIFGGNGADKIWGGWGADTISGDSGDDSIHGNRGDDILDGGDGDDKIFGYAHNDVINGGDGDDRLHGNFGDDILDGGDGHDKIFGYGDDDVANGGAGDDLIVGNFGDDELRGNEGNDTIYGADGTDIIYGGSGNDIVAGNSGNDTIYGKWGEDVIDGGIGTDLCDGGGDSDTETRCEDIISVP